MKLLLIAGLTSQISADPCATHSDFATKSLQEKYKAIRGMTPDEQKKYKYECFKPYETEMKTSNIDYKSVIHQWPSCDMEDENEENCLDREHMFNWMVYDLTGLYPEEFYKCIDKTLNFFEMNKESRAKEIGLSGATYSAREADCNSKGGMMVPNEGNIQTKMNNWNLVSAGDSELIDEKKDTEGKLFGSAMYQYCYYTPGMSDLEICKHLCSELVEKSELFKEKSYLKMYCNVESVAQGRELIRKSDRFEAYLEGTLQD